MKAVDILAKCVEVNEKTGKAVCFFCYFPHTKSCSVSVHLSGYEESPEKTDITFNQYLSEETCRRIDWVNEEPIYSDCNILEELSKLLINKRAAL